MHTMHSMERVRGSMSMHAPRPAQPGAAPPSCRDAGHAQQGGAAGDGGPMATCMPTLNARVIDGSYPAHARGGSTERTHRACLHGAMLVACSHPMVAPQPTNVLPPNPRNHARLVGGMHSWGSLRASLAPDTHTQRLGLLIRAPAGCIPCLAHAYWQVQPNCKRPAKLQAGIDGQVTYADNRTSKLCLPGSGFHCHCMRACHYENCQNTAGEHRGQRGIYGRDA